MVPVLVSDALTKWPLWNELCGLFARREQMHFTTFDLRVNKLQTKETKREKASVPKQRGLSAQHTRTEEWGHGRGQRVEETKSDNTFLWQICSQISLQVTVGVLPLQVLLWRQCYTCLIIYIYYISNTFSLPLPHSAEHTVGRNTDFHGRREGS